MTLILGSGSPRRREILSILGLDYRVVTADADERSELTDPGARVESIAAAKCAAVRDRLVREGMDSADHDTLILTADTLVTIDGIFLGKPLDGDDATSMLARLAGRTHTVASGICLSLGGKTVTAHECTEVCFAPMTAEEIAAYVATGESFGKAGAYAVQGHAARYITGIRGDYFNVVGLPVRRLYETAATVFGIHL